MGLWSRLLRWTNAADALVPSEPAPAPAAGEEPKTVDLPIEPFVFECQDCGKVFEARRVRPSCPECDGKHVSLMSE